MKLCPRCHSRYEDAVRFCPLDGTVLPEPVDEYLGRRLMAQFDIIARCGQGAMGTVYRAHQINMDRMVAIKILRKDLVRDRTVVKRLYREAKAAARLSHPNIITVHLVAETDDGVPYIIMEYLEGTDLDTLCKREAPFQLDRAILYADQIAAALAEAHQHDVVHRDLKPANIIVLDKQRGQDCIKVLDFGIAKILEAGVSDESRITKSGAIFGTPFYLSPEQATGSDLDSRADLYSLGVILYRMVTGHLPFESGSGLDVLVRHVKQPPPPPRLYVPGMPVGLEEVILHALEKDREARFQTADAFRSALARVVAGEVHAVGSQPSIPTPYVVAQGSPADGDPSKIKRTVAGYYSGSTPQAAQPAVVPAVQAQPGPQKVIVAQLTPAPLAFRSPAEAPAPTAWSLPDDAEPATDALPGSERSFPHRVAPPPVSPPIVDVNDDGPRAAPIVAALEPQPIPAAPSSSPSLASGENAAFSRAFKEWRRPGDRGRWITGIALVMAVFSLGVGAFFVVRDLRTASSAGDASVRNGTRGREPGGPRPADGSQAATDAPDATAPITPTLLAQRVLLPEGVRVAHQGFLLRIGFDSSVSADRDLLLVVDVSRHGVRRAVTDAVVQLTIAGDSEPARSVPARATAVKGRYAFALRFARPGERTLELGMNHPDGVTLTVPLRLSIPAAKAEPADPGGRGMRPDAMRDPMDPGHSRPPPGDLPRLPPDDVMTSPMDTLPPPPMDPPTPPADPDPDP